MTSIIILTYNKLEYTQKCIDSIRRFTLPGSYEIIVIDNHSSDGTIEWLKAQSDLKTISNSENLGFPKGCNQGIEMALGDSILLLGNDTLVTPNWLENMLKCLLSADDIGAVGVVTNSGSAQQVPVTYTTMDEMIEFSKGFNISDSGKWEDRLKLTRFCMLVRKEAVEKIGGLDERYSPGSFEDDDYSLRLVKAGYRLKLCRDTFVHHFGGISFNQIGQEFSALFSLNRQKFKEKWGFSALFPSYVHDDLINLIDHSKSQRFSLLEVGCACGANLLKIRHKYENAELFGIESNADAACIAKTVADVAATNIETDNLYFEESSFDYILFTDILEHLNNPWAILKQARKYLKPDGKILAKIPNVIYFPVLRNLLKGKWSYEDTGVLDRGHLRFFTLSEISRMFLDAGYKDLHYMGIIPGKSKEDSEFLQSVTQISGPDIAKQFDISFYLVKASVHAFAAEDTENTLAHHKKRVFLTLFPEAENFHLVKDVGMIPYIMHKYFSCHSIIACYKNGEYPYLGSEVKGMKVDFIEKVTGDSEADSIKYIKKNALSIDILHLFHLCKRSLNLIVNYKALNPKGKVYLKLDASVHDKKITLTEPIVNILKLCDLISIETKHLYEYFNEHWPVRIEYIPNGFYDNSKREEISLEDKENIICTVGRIGSPEKAHHLLTEAFSLASPYIPEWKLKVIGPVAEPFKPYIANFFERNSQLKDKIIFTGGISDRKILDEEYKRAKVFCMTSIYESFGLVFVEAAKNGCFIVSSDIIPAWDITDNKKYGDIFEVGNIKQLSETLIRCCKDGSRLRANCKSIQNFAYDNFYWVEICKKIDSFLRRE